VDLPLPLPPATPIINGWKEILFMPNDTGTATEPTGDRLVDALCDLTTLSEFRCDRRRRNTDFSWRP
jgi:hypothetical protein